MNIKKLLSFSGKGQGTIIAALVTVMVGILALIISNSFIDVGNFQGSLGSLVDTLPLAMVLLIFLAIFGYMGVSAVFR
jgi:hypothetical protein